MSRQDRKDLIAAIEAKRESKVICYVTSDRPGLSVQIAGDVVSLIHEHILTLNQSERSKLDLFIYSRGGHSDVPWTIVSMFREYSEKGSFSVLIPYRAHSAATVIALGADEIVMTKKAELGPIDITISDGPYNPRDNRSNQVLPISVENVTGYFSLMEKVGCERPDEKMKGFEDLTKNVHPLALGEVSRILEQTKLVASRLLSTRAKPFSEEDNQEIVKRISSEIFSHNHTISRTEALRYIGLKQIINAEDIEIDDPLWQLYTKYKDLFLFEEYFRPEEYLISNNVDEHTWNDLNLACIESINRFDIVKQNLRVRKIRQTPPQVTLNLQNISLPAINISNLPSPINQAQVNQLIQQIINTNMQQYLNNAVQIATQQFIQSLPQAGFERSAFNSRWETEV